MNTDTKPRVNDEFIIEKFDNEILLYTQETTKAIYLNEAAYLVWECYKQGLTTNQTIESLEELFPDQKEQIRADVLSATKLLQQYNVIDLVDE